MTVRAPEGIDLPALVAGRPAGTDPRVTAIFDAGKRVIVFGRDWHVVLRRRRKR